MATSLEKVSELERAIQSARTPAEANTIRRRVSALQKLIGARHEAFHTAWEGGKAYCEASATAGAEWDRISPGSGGSDHGKREISRLQDVGFADSKDATMCVRIGTEVHPEDRRAYYQECLDKGRVPSLGGLYAVWHLFYGAETITGPMYADNEGVEFGFWALARPLTATWGSGEVWKRMVAELHETPDVAFGRTDQIPGSILAIDRKTGYEWASMPEFKDEQFRFGYWDPPYDRLYKAEAVEIWRTCRKLAILHTYVYPRAWLSRARRKGMYAVTMGPMKQIRCLQVFEKANVDSPAPSDD